jgi:hypothetical protein
VEGRQLRDRDAILIDLIGVAGLVAFAAGLVILQTSDKLGFQFDAAISGVLGQLGVTLPAAALVLGACALELAAGLVLVRLLRTAPFDSLAEAGLAAMVGAVIKDTLLLGTLGAFGMFRGPALIGIDVAIIAAGLWLAPLARRARPIVGVRWNDLPGQVGSLTVAALVAIVWAGPTILQLASPVVPFIDVLPNHVAPVEHLRTFGWFSPLSATQSPIFGPSRTVLGYDALLGSLASITNLPGALAIAAFILPQSLLVAAGAHRLATAIRGTDAPIGPWALLAFALSQPFARLADARGTVVVVPLVCLGLALAAEALRASPGPGTGDPRPWRLGRGPLMGLALGAAALVHPVIGFLAIVTVAVVTIWRPRELAADALVAGVTAGIIAIPQLATMIGSSLPTLALGGAVAVAIVVGLALGRTLLVSRGAVNATIALARFMRVVVAVVAVGGFILALALGPLDAERIPAALTSGATLVLESSGLLLVVLLVGAALGSRGARSPIVLAGLGVGAGALVVLGVLPGGLGLLGDALRYEVPKTLHYWLSTVAAAAAAAALAHGWRAERVPLAGRGLLVAAFVVLAATPLRIGNSGDDRNCTQDCAAIDPYHLGEHRYAETFAIDLHFAGSGFWVGFPDSRTVVDAPRRQLVDAIRAEIDAGRLAHDTPVLHLGRSFQQWASTPLGVFAGVTETFVSLDPETSQHTVGGRLFGLEDLPGFLASGTYRYVVLEPDGLPDGLRDAILGAGYVPIYANGQGEVFRLPG